MLERLGQILRKATDKIANAIFLDKNLVDDIVRDLQRALIEADVNVILVKQITDKIKKTAFDERIKGIDKKEHLIKVLHDELIAILGEHKELKLVSGKTQNRIILLGLYGAGKTTTIVKLGNYFAKRGNKVALVGLDVHRPAASEQLKQLAEKHKLNYFINIEEKNAIKIWKKFETKLKPYDIVLIDTAGRHTLDEELINEIKFLTKEIKPTERILILPADIGQAAKKQTRGFQDAIKISGVIITRMDSSAKGGGALTACAETQAPVYFIGTGEKINDLEQFNPKSFLARLLNRGDLDALIEKIKSVTGENEQKKLKQELEDGKLNLENVIEQVKSMNSLGGFSKIKSLIPGFSDISKKIPENVFENQEAKIARWEHILKSMTKKEKENPNLFEDKKTGNSRINRVAKGAGVHNSDIKSLLKQYKLLNEMMSTGKDIDLSKGLNSKQLQKLAKKFGKQKRIRF